MLTDIFTSVIFKDKELYISNVQLPFQEARQSCQKIGAELGSISDYQEFVFLNPYLKEKGACDSDRNYR